MGPITPAQLEGFQAALRRLSEQVRQLGAQLRSAVKLWAPVVRAIGRRPAFGSSKLQWLRPATPRSLAAARRLPGPVLRTREEQLALWRQHQADGPPPGAIGSAHSWPRSRLPR